LIEKIIVDSISLLYSTNNFLATGIKNPN